MDSDDFVRDYLGETAVNGNSPIVRAGFARGRCVRGAYIPSDRAAEITKSLSFTRPSRVLARFSADDGNPKVAGDDNLVLRGFSFRLGDVDRRSDILTQSAPVHDAKTLEQMLPFLKTRIPRPNGKPDAKEINALSSANREKLLVINHPEQSAGVTLYEINRAAKLDTTIKVDWSGH